MFVDHVWTDARVIIHKYEIEKSDFKSFWQMLLLAAMISRISENFKSLGTSARNGLIVENLVTMASGQNYTMR